MFKKGGFFYWFKIILILAAVGTGFFCTHFVLAAEKININTATLEELDTLPGIGLAKAQAIIDYRAVQPFIVIEDIMKVTGIKQATFDGIKDLITVGVNTTPLNPPLSGGTDNPSVPTLPGGQNQTATSSAENTSPPDQEGVNIKLGEVVINEFVADPADGEVEWVELLNKNGQEINLTGWRLEDGSQAKTSLTGILGSSNEARYKVIEKPTGNLNNAGDLITLYDADGKIIDRVAYGNWDDGDLTNNALAANDPASVARKFDGYNTFNNANDFAVTLKPTKGAANIIETEAEINATAKAGYDFSNEIYLSEILPNPAGDDSQGEFVEIFNAGSRPVDLTGWSLSNEDGKKIYWEKAATSTIIQVGQYLVLWRLKSKLVLHNDRGEVRLYQPLSDKPLEVMAYENVKEGWSYNQTNDSCTWSETPTPGMVNIIKKINYAPEADFSAPAEVLIGRPAVFDGSDAFDDDGDKLIFVWDFGDGFKNDLSSPEHTFFKAGIYEVKLTVSDGRASSTKAKIVKAVASLNEMSDEGVINPSGHLYQGGTMIINEVMPNPKGADTGSEWLELKNQSGERINLLNWRVENENGKYKFKEELWLAAGEYYVLKDSESKLTLKNSADTVSLYELGKLIDRTEYDGVAENESYARGLNANWFWTSSPTPGRENKISLAGDEIGLEPKVLSNKIYSGDYTETELAIVKEMELGSLVKARGTVAVEPGILGAQIFYIVVSPTSEEPMAGQSGIQIYNYKKDFPALKIGDYIEVSGELTQALGELRLKTKSKDDIRLLERRSAPTAVSLSCDQVNEEAVGQLIAVKGEITDKNSSSLYLDDGSDEILVYLKKAAGIDAKTVEPGQQVTIAGILSRTQAGLRLLPRGPADVVASGTVDGLTPRVLGETIETDEWELAARDKKLELFKYLLIIAAAIIVILSGLFMKAKKII